jgi:hypothetical protein
MSAEKFCMIYNAVQKYFSSTLHRNPFTYLVAKDGNTFYAKDKIAPETEGNNLLERYVKNYFDYMKENVDEVGLYDWDLDSPEESLLVKSFGLEEEDFYKKILSIKKLIMTVS